MVLFRIGLFLQNPEQVLANSQQHVYATPSRVQTPDALLDEEQQAHMYNTRRSKLRTCTLPQAYSTMVRRKLFLIFSFLILIYFDLKLQRIHLFSFYFCTRQNYPGNASIYNETEFSTRETLYAPSHLILPTRPKYAMY